MKYPQEPLKQIKHVTPLGQEDSSLHKIVGAGPNRDPLKGQKWKSLEKFFHETEKMQRQLA